MAELDLEQAPETARTQLGALLATARALPAPTPRLAEIELTNYKVRILDEHHGTGAVTRVLLDSSDGERDWGSIGVSENSMEASWEAPVDSLEYAVQPNAQGAQSESAEGSPRRGGEWRRRSLVSVPQLLVYTCTMAPPPHRPTARY